MVVVSDTSPIINLAMIGYLELLPKLFNKIILPQAVYDEIVKNGSGMPGSIEISKATWIAVMSCNNHLLIDELSEHLDFGESEAIALALEIHATLILMDEDLGRKIAVQYHLRPLGLLGILLRAKSAGMIPLVKPIMDLLQERARFFIHPKLYTEVLLLANEHVQ